MRKTVIVTGCFDVPHIGHVRLLEWAATFGLPIHMGINSDRAIRLLKGEGRPVYSQEDRKCIWAAFKPVAMVTIVDSTNMVDYILDEAAQIWVKGSDWTLETMNQEEVAAAAKVGTEIRFFPRLPGASTTETIQRSNQWAK